MKKSAKIAIAIVTMLAFTITTFASEAPPKKTQIDWLISGAGGDVAAAGGDCCDVNGQFSYEFSAENGSNKGIVVGNSGTVRIFTLLDDGKYSESPDTEAAKLARLFTVHFATLTRTDHFHASHRLSERSTEEYPTHLGSSKFITFCYRSLDNGGMMNAMIIDNKVKLVTNLQRSTRDVPISETANDPNNPSNPNNPNNQGGSNDPNNPNASQGSNTGGGSGGFGTGGSDSNPKTGISIALNGLAVAGMALLKSRKWRIKG
jgi:hypothetical protein